MLSIPAAEVNGLSTVALSYRSVFVRPVILVRTIGTVASFECVVSFYCLCPKHYYLCQGFCHLFSHHGSTCCFSLALVTGEKEVTNIFFTNGYFDALYRGRHSATGREVILTSISCVVSMRPRVYATAEYTILLV